MQDLNELRSDLIQMTRELHAKEKRLILDSVWLIGELDRLRCDAHLGMSVEQFVKHIGLTPNVYFKRLKASRILHAYPQVAAMLKAGETSVSQISLLHAKLTPANADLVFEGIRNKSKREVEQFLSRVTFDGQLLDKEPEVELRLVLTRSQLEMLERAREILAASGHVPSSSE